MMLNEQGYAIVECRSESLNTHFFYLKKIRKDSDRLMRSWVTAECLDALDGSIREGTDVSFVGAGSSEIGRLREKFPLVDKYTEGRLLPYNMYAEYRYHGGSWEEQPAPEMKPGFCVDEAQKTGAWTILRAMKRMHAAEKSRSVLSGRMVWAGIAIGIIAVALLIACGMTGSLGSALWVIPVSAFLMMMGGLVLVFFMIRKHMLDKYACLKIISVVSKEKDEEIRLTDCSRNIAEVMNERVTGPVEKMYLKQISLRGKEFIRAYKDAYEAVFSFSGDDDGWGFFVEKKDIPDVLLDAINSIAADTDNISGFDAE